MLPLKDIIQALLGQAKLGDNCRAFVGISSSMGYGAKDRVFQPQGEASCVLGGNSLACEWLNEVLLQKASQLSKFGG